MLCCLKIRFEIVQVALPTQVWWVNLSEQARVNFGERYSGIRDLGAEPEQDAS